MPAVFRSTTPAWNNPNLRELARVTVSHCVLAHVRAATPPLPVTQLNCHPFVAGELALMHNGFIPGFSGLRRRILSELAAQGLGDLEEAARATRALGDALDKVRALREKREREQLNRRLSDDATLLAEKNAELLNRRQRLPAV